jgi:hypothetical protein
MRHADDHIRDEELLQTSDGESSIRRANQVRAHVANCPRCRARMEEIEGAAADFDRLYRGALNREVPPPASSRTSLERRLAALSSGSSPSSRFRRRVNPFSLETCACVCAAVLLLAALTMGWLNRPASKRETRAIAVPQASGPVLPDVHLTPGATRPVTADQICVAGGPPELRPPLRVQQAVFHEYGMDAAPAQEYEVDHLITPGLGGTDDIRNLWPEPYTSTEWNAHVKDELEDYLHDLVCGGKLDLATAQHDMASNWILAYKKYFHADQPLPHTSDLIDDRHRTPKG